MRSIMCVLFGLALAGCATVVTGTSQPVAIESDPPGASCRVSQSGYQVGAVLSTPGYVSVHKGSGSLDVTCEKPGYRTAQQSVPFGLQGWLLGNALIGGLVGIVVDFSSGAAFEYAPGTMLALRSEPDAPVAATSVQGAAYASLSDGRSSNPLLVQPKTPRGDVTYIWGGPSAH